MARRNSTPVRKSAPKRVAQTIRTSNYYLKIFLLALLIFLLGAVSAYRFLQRLPVNNLQTDLPSNQITLNPSVQPSIEPVGSLFASPTSTNTPIVAKPQPSNTPPSLAKTAPGSTYTVKKGDSLWKIAQEAYGDPYQWVAIYSQNKSEIGQNPNILYAGMQLNVPAAK